MQHQDIDRLMTIASVESKPRPTMSKQERLNRWADLLEAQGDRRLRPLQDVEYVGRAERPTLRANDSPIAVAHEDSVLRSEGLTDDTLGNATEFFGLSEGEAHHILCTCHYGGMMMATEVSRRIRNAARMPLAVKVWSSMTGIALVATTAILVAAQ